MAVSRRLFGTDGIRGKANTHPMTAEMALRLGQAAGLRFTRGTHRHRVVIGKDTRLSGYMLEPALTAGFVGAGMDVTLVGPMPTPAVAMLTRSLRADLGVMISASHNPFEDNGIKLFDPDGCKLSDAMEAEIEALMASDMSARLAAPSALGRAARLDDAHGRYVEAAKATFPRGLRLDGLRIAVDCANGAAYRVAPDVLWELGATVIKLGVSPDGFNINQGCGSTVPEYLCNQVVEHGADLRHRAGWRRGPSAAGGRARRPDRRRPDPGANRPRLGPQRPAERRRDRGDGNVEPRAGTHGRGARDAAAPHRGRGPARGRADAGRGDQRGRRAVRPYDPFRFRHHGRRDHRRFASSGDDRGGGASRERGLPRVHPAAAAAPQRPLHRGLAAEAHHGGPRDRRREPGAGGAWPIVDPGKRHRTRGTG